MRSIGAKRFGSIICIFILSCSFSGLRDSYVSGDLFRSWADWIFDETSIFDPKDVRAGDVIFLKTDYLDRFAKMHEKITVPYILITHNSDWSAPKQYSFLLKDEKLLAWFATNADRIHPKLHFVPIGIPNPSLPYGDVEIFDRAKSEECSKEIALYLNFAPHTYPREREKVYAQFIWQPFCTASLTKDLYSYLVDLRKSRFVLSPRGSGLDTYRLWECLYMGAIPIVRSSSIDYFFEDLPVIIVEKWEEVTLEFLEEKWEEMQKKEYAWEKLSPQYWFEQIQQKKKCL